MCTKVLESLEKLKAQKSSKVATDSVTAFELYLGLRVPGCGASRRGASPRTPQ